MSNDDGVNPDHGAGGCTSPPGRGRSQAGPLHAYVVGFLIDHDRREVALVKKRKPAWQAGRFNGIGGKIEPGESPFEAMVREFREEAGADIRTWHEFAALGDHATFDVRFFVAFATDLRALVRTVEYEEIVVVPIAAVSVENAIPNLTWLIPMALTLPYERAGAFTIFETITDPASRPVRPRPALKHPQTEVSK